MAILIILAPFFTYLFTAPPSIFAGDSGDLIVAIAARGFSHPPGYPLYTILGLFWTKIVPWGSMAWRMNIFSGVISTLALIVLFLFLMSLTKDLLSSIVAVLTLAFTYTFWEFSIVAEVFALNSLIALLFLFFSFRFLQTQKIKFVYLSALIFALGVAHNHMIALWLPGVAVFILIGFKKYLAVNSYRLVFLNKAFWRISLKALGLFTGTAGLLYLYLPWSVAKGTRYVWGDATSLIGLRDIFFRKAYGTFQIARGLSTTAVSRLTYLKVYPTFLVNNFTVVGILLAGLGVLYLFLLARRKVFNPNISHPGPVLLATVLNFLISGPLFLIYAGLPFSSFFYLGMLEKFGLMSLLIIPIWLCLGVIALVKGLQAFLGKLRFLPSKSKACALVLISPYLVFSILPINLIINNFPKLNLHENREGYLFSLDILNQAEENAAIYVSGDTPLFNTLYVHRVEGVRSDVWVLHGSKKKIYAQLKQLKADRPNIKLPQWSEGEENDVLTSFFEENVDKLPLYVLAMSGLNSPKLTVVPEGFLARVYPKGQTPSTEKLYEKLQSNMIASRYLNEVDFNFNPPAYLKTLRYDAAFMVGKSMEYLLVRSQNFEKGRRLAEYYLIKSMEIEPKVPETYFTLGLIYAVQKKCQRAENRFLNFAALSNSAPPNLFYNLYYLYKDCFKNPKKAQKYWKIYKERLPKEENKTQT